MKKVILSLVVILTVGMATAKEKETFGFAKNDVFLGGSLKGTSISDKDNYQHFYIKFYPTVAYFIKDNFAVGANLLLGYGKTETENIRENERMKSVSESRDIHHAYEVDIFGRYYFLNLGKRFKIYNQLNFGYGKETSKVTMNSSYENFEHNTKDSRSQVVDRDRKIYNTNIGLGLNYFLTQNFILKAYLGQLIGYSYTKDGDNYRKEFKFKLNSQNVSFGIAYKF